MYATLKVPQQFPNGTLTHFYDFLFKVTAISLKTLFTFVAKYNLIT